MKINDITALELDREQMRSLGYRVIDMLVDHHVQLKDKAATRNADRVTMEALFREPPPDFPTDPEEVLLQVERDIVGHTMHANHPRFFAFIPGPSNFVGVLGDALASGFNVISALWLESSAPTQVELVTIDWLRELCGLPQGAGGLFVSGGSMANLTGLATARHVRLRDQTDGAMVYCSAQVHASLTKNLRVLGFMPEQVANVAVDQSYRMDIDELKRCISQDRAKGRRPFCVIATAGTTNTGAVDPLDEMADVCKQHNMWLHVDGAYGAAAVLSSTTRSLLAGLARADSIAVDPHKWLFQPFEIGCALVRDASWLPRTFGAEHEYMQDAVNSLDQQEVNLCDYGVQLTRGFRALKLWMTIKVFGLNAIREAIDRGIRHAELAEKLLRECPVFEVVTPAQLGIVSFRYTPTVRSCQDVDTLNARIVETCIKDGYAMISSTVLAGRTTLRLCTINPRTTEQDLVETVARIARFGDELAAA